MFLFMQNRVINTFPITSLKVKEHNIIWLVFSLVIGIQQHYIKMMKCGILKHFLKCSKSLMIQKSPVTLWQIKKINLLIIWLHWLIVYSLHIAMTNTYQITCVLNLGYKEGIYMDVGRENHWLGHWNHDRICQYVMWHRSKSRMRWSPLSDHT